MNQQEQFEQVFNQCLERLFKGESIETILLDFPEQADQLKPLLKVAAAGRIFSRVQPRQDFKSRARYEFLAAARELEAHPRRRWAWRWSWHSAWAMAVTAVAVVVLAGGGTIWASNSSLPGETLYGVKISSENVQLALTFSDVDKTELNAKFANRRTTEIESLVLEGDTEQIQLAAANFSQNLNNLSHLAQGDLLLTDDEASSTANAAMFNTEMASNNQAGSLAVPSAKGSGGGSPELDGQTGAAPAEDTARSTRDGAPAGEPVTSAVSPMLAPAPQAFKALTHDNQVYASETVPEIPGADAPVAAPEVLVTTSNREPTKYDLMRQIIETNFQERQDHLLAALAKARTELKPIIKQALAESEYEYWKAIRSLDLNSGRE